MRRGWKVPLRRAQISHAIGRLCPDSAPLTQLPRGCRGVGRVRPRERSADSVRSGVPRPPISHLALALRGGPFPVLRCVFAFVTGNTPNSLFTADWNEWMKADAPS